MPRVQAKSTKNQSPKPNKRGPKQGIKSNSPRRRQANSASSSGLDNTRLQAALDQLQDGFAVFSAIRDAASNIADFRLDYINDAGCRTHQMDRADLVGKTLLTIYPRHKENGLFDAYVQVVETGTPLCQEYPASEELFRDTAAVAIGSVNATKLGDGFAITWRDATEQLRAQTALESQASSLRDQAELLDLAHDAIFVRDLSSVILFWNRGAQVLYGWNKSEALGTMSHRLLKTQFPQPLEGILDQVAREGRWEGELTHTRRDGSTIVVHSRWALRRDGQGNPVSILEINSDITLRKRAEEQLRASEALFRQVLETLPVGVWIQDKHGNIVHGNTAAREIWQGAKYVGIEQFGEYKGWWLSNGKRIEPEEWAAARAIQKGETSLNEEIEIECFDGTRKIILNFAVPIRNEQQQITGAIIVNQDITRRKQGERQARANAARAEALVRFAARLNARLDLDAVLATVCEQAAQALNAPAAWVNLYNPDRQVLDPAAFFGMPPEFTQLYVSPSRAIYEENALRADSPNVIQDVRALHDIPNTRAYAQADIRTVASGTMRQKNELIGVLCVPSFHTVRDYTADDLALLQGFADIAAQAILNARLHSQVRSYGAEMERRVLERTAELEATNEELQLQVIEREQAEEQILQQNHELAVLYAVAQASTQSTEVDEILNAALKTTLGALRFECGAIALLQRDGVSFGLGARQEFSKDFLSLIQRTVKSELAASVADRDYKPVVHDLASESSPSLSAAARLEGIQTLVCVPLVAGGSVIGLLNLGARKERTLTPEELRLLSAVGQQLGVAIQSAQLYAAIQSELEGRLRIGKEREGLLAQLEAERNRWKATVESMLDPVTVSDAQGRAIYMNAAYSKMVELTINAELDLDNHPQFYQLYKTNGTKFAPEELPLQRAALFGEQVRDVEIVQGTPAGQEHIAIWNAAPIRDAQGQVTGAVAIGHEITEQRRMQRERERLLGQLEEERDKLREASERVASILSSITDAYYTFDREWRFTDVNPNAETHFGRPREELVGQNIWTLYAQTVGGEFYEQFHRAMREQVPVHFEAKSEISRRWLETHAYPSAQGLTVYFRDITERKESEQAIHELNRALERRATELEIANQELEAFSYSVSHDLRTPLHSVEGFARLLVQEHGAELTPTTRRYAELVSANTQAMIELVNALLNLSRTARQPLRKQRVEPAELVRQALKEQAPQPAGHQIQLELGELPPCNADPVLLKQIFVNLLSNAIKFTRTRQVARIEIGSAPLRTSQLGTIVSDPASSDREPSPVEIAYFVRDNGVGFDMDQADKLFGVFQRLHSEEAYEGTGIGLATVARIVHRHGGRVWAESAQDRGATFYFTLE